MRRGDEATHSGQIQAANTRRESATPALTTQRCWHISSAVGHVRAVLMGDNGVAPSYLVCGVRDKCARLTFCSETARRQQHATRR